MTEAVAPHSTLAPSPWVARWAHLITPKSQVLDVACGHGRHMRYLAGLGHAVLGVDQNAEALASCAGLGETLCADIENAPWPLPGRSFGGIVVTHYLWRALLPQIVSSLAEGGVLIYETFASGNETVGKPSRPDFLLRPGELLEVCRDLRVVAFEEGFLSAPDRFVQRIVAVRPQPHPTSPIRYPL